MTINQTTPASSPLDTLKALVHRNISSLEYVTDRLGGDFGNDVSEDILEFLDYVVQEQYNALNEHVAVSTEKVGYATIRRIADDGYTYDDGSPVKEHFDGHGLTSTYYPRYDGNRDAAQARHFKSVAEMNLRFAEEMEAKSEGREWPPPNESDTDANEVDDQGQDGSSTDL